jgi:hypothetical protein
LELFTSFDVESCCHSQPIGLQFISPRGYCDLSVFGRVDSLDFTLHSERESLTSVAGNRACASITLALEGQIRVIFYLDNQRKAG